MLWNEYLILYIIILYFIHAGLHLLMTANVDRIFFSVILTTYDFNI